MLNIVMKNAPNAEHLQQVIRERFEPLAKKFPDLRDHQITVVVDVDDAATAQGSECLSLKAVVTGRKYRGVTLTGKVGDIYAASAKVAARMLTLLRRAGQRARARSAFRLRPLLPMPA